MEKGKIVLIATFLFLQIGFSVPLMTIGMEFGPAYPYLGSTYLGGRITYSPFRKEEINLFGDFHQWVMEVDVENYDYAKVYEFFLLPTFNYVLLKKYSLSFKVGVGAGVNISSAYYYHKYEVINMGYIHLDGLTIFPSLVSSAELSYHIPKTTAHLSIGVRHHDHIGGYWKEFNHYFSMVYSFSFELFK